MDNYPLDFIHNLRDHFGEDIAGRVTSGLTEIPSISVRMNRGKPTDRFSDQRPVPWTESAFLLTERPTFSLDPAFHGGAYYVQDSSSMILEEVLRQLKFDRDGILALDACAAPGGKSLILSDFLENIGFLISNEIDGKRNAILTENLMKWGSAHHGITQLSSAKLSELTSVFDLVVIDAPCSGEGMFRKDEFAVKQWSPALVDQCVTTQANILNDLSEVIAEGGYLVYSTCTMNPKENELQIESLLEAGFELALPNLDRFSGYVIPAEKDQKQVGFYLLPGISTGEGLFVSVLRKTNGDRATNPRKGFQTMAFQQESITDVSQADFSNQWSKMNVVYGLNDPFQLLHRLPQNMAFKSVGLPILEPKGKDMIPLHGLSMMHGAIPDIDLDLKEALDYLRKGVTSAPSKLDKKWMKVGFEQLVLGWVKQVPGRLNNYYPSNYRLRI